ncbi:hypothetical protein AB1Y20_018330 [Prymnesium parvum]|uniref:DNA primase n=1 Tax=Prymnesium parvum TaxID=97485 RepID=A0AB34JRD7_PRYPA
MTATEEITSKKQRRIVEDEDPMEEEVGSALGIAPVVNLQQQEFSEELLRMYYDRIFPASLMCRWLSYGTQHEDVASQHLLPRREFSFTTGDDVYIRYLSYENAAALKKDLVSKLPFKIDIGAIFSAAPRDHKKFKVFQPVQRELIIDIDLTDYDFLDVDVTRLETCDRCWPLMALAMKVLTRALNEDFGFQHLLWVYSGRRGIHCWVCDPRARAMSNEVRSAVADYLGPRISAATGRLSISIPMHPSLISAYENYCKPFFFNKMLPSEPEGFGILDNEAGRTKLLDMLGDESLKESVAADWARRSSGVEMWKHLEHVTAKSQKLCSVLAEIVFTYTFPRLDVNVSKGMNHLLKSPWCVHPKTGRVCVPVEPGTEDAFQPNEVPTLRILEAELNQEAPSAESKAVKDISRTRLAQYEAAFDQFLKRLENSIRGEKARKAKAVSMEF